ncbi:MAG: GIY-YIG nuclease family protein [Candidatus Melainabacteria bacterium]|jgi:putative endonuclease
MKNGFVYILTNFNKTVLYVGVTSNLEQRLQEHRQLSERASKFAAKYKCKYLIYYEKHQTISDAILREKQLKNWHREWKLNLIREINPDFEDLSESL